MRWSGRRTESARLVQQASNTASSHGGYEPADEHSDDVVRELRLCVAQHADHCVDPLEPERGLLGLDRPANRYAV